MLGFCPILPATYVAISEGQYEANAGTEPVSGGGETSGGSPLQSILNKAGGNQQRTDARGCPPPPPTVASLVCQTH